MPFQWRLEISLTAPSIFPAVFLHVPLMATEVNMREKSDWFHFSLLIFLRKVKWWAILMVVGNHMLKVNTREATIPVFSNTISQRPFFCTFVAFCHMRVVLTAEYVGSVLYPRNAASNPRVEPSKPLALPSPPINGVSRLASCLPSSTPHWSKAFSPHSAPRQKTLCS